MTTRLKFNDHAAAVSALQAAGLYAPDFRGVDRPVSGVVFLGNSGVIWKDLPDDQVEIIPGIHVDLKGDCPASLVSFRVPEPSSPFHRFLDDE